MESAKYCRFKIVPSDIVLIAILSQYESHAAQTLRDARRTATPS
ncbi:hypothetical protein C7S16_3542 [Burkholderia thailandensis]|uniref:Uncharacterized protein n=1 Tax=Burkholderia thailandensis TaxID=57975 RepID=A0AAW9D546_BURTH|nr:hypothetical protein [Burkholderia thailandensis]